MRLNPKYINDIIHAQAHHRMHLRLAISVAGVDKPFLTQEEYERNIHIFSKVAGVHHKMMREIKKYYKNNLYIK